MNIGSLLIGVLVGAVGMFFGAPFLVDLVDVCRWGKR